MAYYYVQSSVDYRDCRAGRYVKFLCHLFIGLVPHELALDQQPVALVVYPFIYQVVKL